MLEVQTHTAETKKYTVASLQYCFLKSAKKYFKLIRIDGTCEIHWKLYRVILASWLTRATDEPVGLEIQNNLQPP